MRTLLAVAATAALVAACAPDSDKTNPAIATDESVAERASAAPAAGASSFTEDQARERITTAGYTDVTALAKADDGTWRGSAMMGGQNQTVILDYQGNVTGTPVGPATAPGNADPTMPATPASPPQPTP